MAKNDKIAGAGMIRAVLFSGALCILCCAAPLLGLFAGSAAVVSLAIFPELFVIAAVVIVIGIIIFNVTRRKSGATCHLDKGCGPQRRPDGEKI